MDRRVCARLTSLNRGEVLHYLGYDGQPLDDALESQIQRCMERVTGAASPRLIWLREATENEDLAAGSTDLQRMLDGCGEVILLAATIGARVDQLIQRYEILDMGDALIMDACASAAIENVCDNAEHELREMLHAEGVYLTDRFSPGYGDYPLTEQGRLCARLDTGRKIGLTLTDSGLMIPRKSVTAVMGISAHPVQHRGRNCETCSLGADCPYRKGQQKCIGERGKKVGEE